MVTSLHRPITYAMQMYCNLILLAFVTIFLLLAEYFPHFSLLIIIFIIFSFWVLALEGPHDCHDSLIFWSYEMQGRYCTLAFPSPFISSHLLFPILHSKYSKLTFGSALFCNTKWIFFWEVEIIGYKV